MTARKAALEALDRIRSAFNILNSADTFTLSRNDVRALIANMETALSDRPADYAAPPAVQPADDELSIERLGWLLSFLARQYTDQVHDDCREAIREVLLRRAPAAPQPQEPAEPAWLEGSASQVDTRGNAAPPALPEATARAERAEEALREDAERYRWLRMGNVEREQKIGAWIEDADGDFYPIPEALDAAIDAARRGGKK